MMNVIRKKLGSKRGFTLVEILVVILIIGILFVAFLPRIDFAGDKARETNVKTDLRTYILASEQLFKENAGYPAALDDTGTPVIRTKYNELLDPSLRIDTVGTDGIAKAALEDPWGTTYKVQFFEDGTSSKRSILIYTHGKIDNADNDAPVLADYGAVVTYQDGMVTSATFGLGNDIGDMTGYEATDIKGKSRYTIADFGISKLTVVNGKITVSP